MKTIAEIAREIGVSKTAIHKKIKQEPLKSKVANCSQTIDNALRIDNNGEQLIKSAFTTPKVDEPITEVDTSTTSADEPITNLRNENDNNGEQLIKSAFTAPKVDEPITKVNTSTTLVDEVITNLRNENEYLRQQNKQFQEQLTIEREHSRDIAEKLVELTRNSQVLLKQEQDKTAFLLPEQQTKRPFWQFWKK